MEYKLKLTLLDDKGNPLVSSSFTEQLLSDMKQFHKVDFIQEMVSAMKLEYETGSTVAPLDEPDSGLSYLKRRLDERRDRWSLMEEQRKWFAPAGKERGSIPEGMIMGDFSMPKMDPDFLMMWIEEGVRVTREDVQDYMAFTGVDQEEAYKRLKSYYLGETRTI